MAGNDAASPSPRAGRFAGTSRRCATIEEGPDPGAGCAGGPGRRAAYYAAMLLVASIVVAFWALIVVAVVRGAT